MKQAIAMLTRMLPPLLAALLPTFLPALLTALCVIPVLQLSGCSADHPVIQPAGAIGDGKTKDTAAIQQALDQCAAQGGGQVVIPAGKFLIGSIQLPANTTLKLSEGATLIGSPDPDDYPLVPVRFEGETVQGHRALIYAKNADHIAILGPGTLQGDEQIGDLRRPRAPVMIELENCGNIRLEDFKDRYSRMWSVHLLFCHDVLARNLNIRTTKTNGDGIDVDSTTHVNIDHCDIDTGDDCISLKSGRGAEAAKLRQSTANIHITDCTLGSNFAGVGIGTEISGGVRDVLIERCKFTRGDNAIFLKSRLGRGGFITNITATDLDTSSKTCLGINLVNKGIVGADPILGLDGITVMSRIALSNITIHAGILVDGLNVPLEKPIDGLSLTHVTGHCKTGISLANVVNARLKDIHVTGYKGPLLMVENVTGTGLEGAVPPGNSGMKQLHESFESPPDDARPMVRWWWFGPAVTKPELQREINAMKAGGFGGFEVQPTYPLAVDGQPAGLVNLKFLSPEFLDDLKFAATAAKDAGMRMDLTLGSGWPYGGPMFPITEAAGRLRIARIKPSPGQTQISPGPLRAGESLIAAFAGNTELKLADQKAQLPADAAAPGEVLFFISSHTGMKVKRPALGAEGYVIDHDNLSVVAKFIDQIGNKEVEACGANPPYSVFCDSLEVGGEDWTGHFLAEFQKRRGYDLRPLLPALVSDTPRALEIRHDWGQTLTELFNDSFVKPMRSLAEDHKIKFRIQAYGSPSAGLFSYADADLPEGEGYQWHDYRATRYATSACHLMGVPVSSSETFTWLHGPVFRATPLDIKAEADLHFLQGVNQIICHGWPYTATGVADPGWSFYAPAVFDEKNPWYIAMGDVNQYLTRVSSMMRQGRPANDVALYLANDDAWANFTPGHISLSDGVAQQLGKQIVGDILDAGYNLDFFDDPMLERFGRIEGAGMVFGDTRYKAVVLAGVERIPLSTMRKLEALARGGGVVIATRREPAIAPGYLATDADSREIRDISRRLFHGSGAPGIFIADETGLAAALSSRLAPDVALTPASPQIGFVHRHANYADIYFLANTGNQPLTTRATFRVEGMQPELWNPLTGQTKPIAIIDRPPGGTTVDLTLDAYQSDIILWTTHRPSKTKSRPTPIPESTLDLSTGWTVQFGSDASAAAPAAMQTLHSWTDDPATQNFSGVCTYTRRITIPPDAITPNATIPNATTPSSTTPSASRWLTFGTSTPTSDQRSSRPGQGFAAALNPPVHEAAVVFINGHRAGSVWCPPYRLDVTPWITPGENEIRIDVANTAVNAIAAHGFPNYDTKALTQQFGERFPTPAASEFVPVPSGLLGPITLKTSP